MTSVSPTPTAERLSDRMRASTKAVHRLAERTGLMRQMLTGTAELSLYTALLRNLHDVYGALEPELARHAAEPVVGAIHFPELGRVAAIERDLVTLHGADWATAIPATAAQAYVARIRAVSATTPELLAAHSYVRYLGDLSGGQIIGRLVTRMFGLAAGTGTAFYEFPAIPDVDAFKERYRAALDALPLDAAQSAAVVQEAIDAFLLNAALFDALAPATAA